MSKTNFSSGKKNPMRWQCDTNGCFNEIRRPKIEAFADCFGGNICMGDVDGLVERNNNFLMLEWKGVGGSIQTGQSISYTNFTKPVWHDGASLSFPHLRNMVVVVNGCPETMAVESLIVFEQGMRTPDIPADLADVKGLMRAWFHNVDTLADYSCISKKYGLDVFSSKIPAEHVIDLIDKGKEMLK